MATITTIHQTPEFKPNIAVIAVLTMDEARQMLQVLHERYNSEEFSSIPIGAYRVMKLLEDELHGAAKTE